jgi:hypothetical protein
MDHSRLSPFPESLNYFSKISAEELQNAFVHDAVIRISNGSKTHQLREYKQDLAGGYFSYTYTTDTADLASAFYGEFGKSYSLSIQVDGKEYTASTTIPLLAKPWIRFGPNLPRITRIPIKWC